MVFIDTGGWIAVAVVWDALHEAALGYYFDLISNSVRLFTSNYVLDETITRLRYDFGHAQALQFCERYDQAESQGRVTTLWVDTALAKAALAIFRRYADQRFSFTDCTSFALMQHHSLKQAFTFDSHFEILGFVRQPQVLLPR